MKYGTKQEFLVVARAWANERYGALASSFQETKQQYKRVDQNSCTIDGGMGDSFATVGRCLVCYLRERKRMMIQSDELIGRIKIAKGNVKLPFSIVQLISFKFKARNWLPLKTETPYDTEQSNGGVLY